MSGRFGDYGDVKMKLEDRKVLVAFHYFDAF
jgi:hypothetical protein